MKEIVFLLSLYFTFTLASFAQNSNCEIYESILNYLNDKEKEATYTQRVDPTDSNFNKLIRARKYELNFFIIKSKRRLDQLDVEYWFSELLKDSLLKKHTYISDSCHMVDCIFSYPTKYQYKNTASGNITIKDFNKEIRDRDIVNYSPIRITFSNVLYSNNIALVFVTTYKNIGWGRDTYVYGFVLEKKAGSWIIEKVGIEIL